MNASASSKSPKAAVADKKAADTEKDDVEAVAPASRAASAENGSKAKKDKPGKDVTCNFKLQEVSTGRCKCCGAAWERSR